MSSRYALCKSRAHVAVLERGIFVYVIGAAYLHRDRPYFTLVNPVASRGDGWRRIKLALQPVVKSDFHPTP